MNRFYKKVQSFIKRQNETLDVEYIQIHSQALPKALFGYRIAVLADLHLQALSAFHTQVLDALIQIQPECILIAGDSTDARAEDVRPFLPFFSRLSKIAPTIAVLGNNDCDVLRTPALRDLYQSCSITLLENETRLLLARGIPLQITGLTDPTAFHKKVHVERTAITPDGSELPLQHVKIENVLSADTDTKEWAPPILLLHQPQLALPYAKMGSSLIVAGHAHGGQFRIPLIGGLYAPGQGIFPKYTSGLYHLGASHLVVSRGIGNHAIPLRLLNPPHLPVIVLAP